MNKLNKIIFHLDLNYFYCRCEEIINPALATRPFVVSEMSRRSVVCTSNKIARTFGVKAGMSIFEALKICPNLHIVDIHFDLYKQKSDDFFNLIRKKFTNEIEITSVDECFLDATPLLAKYHNNYLVLAQTMIDEVFRATKLYVTIGIGENKFLAKTAGDFKPTHKIGTLFKHEIPNKLWPLKIEDLYLVGRKTIPLLKNLNIHTVADFINYHNQEELSNLLKKRYVTLLEFCNATSSDDIDYQTMSNKSISSFHTFETNTDSHKLIWETFKKLLEIICEQLTKAKQVAITVSVNIKYTYTSQISKSISMQDATNQYDELWNFVIYLFTELWNEEDLRGIGISVTNLKNMEEHEQQLKLNFN